LRYAEALRSAAGEEPAWLKKRYLSSYERHLEWAQEKGKDWDFKKVEERFGPIDTWQRRLAQILKDRSVLLVLACDAWPRMPSEAVNRLMAGGWRAGGLTVRHLETGGLTAHWAIPPS
jgi:hypothetical protein